MAPIGALRTLPPICTKTEWNALMNYGLLTSCSGTSFPGSPTSGQFCYRTDLNGIYYWNGTSWILSASGWLSALSGSIVDITDNINDLTYPTFTIVNKVLDDGLNFSCWAEVTVTRIEGASGYIFEYKPNVDAAWWIQHVHQTGSGNITFITIELEEATLYDFRANTLSKLSNTTTWSPIQQITTSGSTYALPAPSGLTATAIMAGVILTWTDLGLKGESYKIYRNTSDNTDSAFVIGSTLGSVYTWSVTGSADYTTQYFWVNSVTRGGVESTFGSSVSKTPSQVVSSDLVEGLISGSTIGSGSIVTSHIADLAITTAKLDNAAVSAAKILDGAVVSEKIAALAISGSHIGAGAVVGEKIGIGAVDTAKIANNAITTALLASGSVSASTLADLAVTTAKLANWAVETAKIASGSIITASLAANAVTAAKIEALTITSDQIASNAIIAAKIAAGAIETAKIAAYAVTAAEIAAGAVTSNKIYAGAVVADAIAAGAVVADKIGAGAIITEKLAAGGISADKIAANAIVSDAIAANAIIAEKIAASAITTEKIAANAITGDTIAAGAISTSKLEAGAITANQIAAGAVINSKLGTASITSDKIAADAIVADKISANSISTDKIAINTVTTPLIVDGAITADKISANTITAGQIAAGTITSTEITSTGWLTGKYIRTAASGTRIQMASDYGFYTIGDSLWFFGNSEVLRGLIAGRDGGSPTLMVYGTNHVNIEASNNVYLRADGGGVYVSGDLNPSSANVRNMGDPTNYWLSIFARYHYAKTGGYLTFACPPELSDQPVDKEFTTLESSENYLRNECLKTQKHIKRGSTPDKIVCICGKEGDFPCLEHQDEWNDIYAQNIGKMTIASSNLVISLLDRVIKLEDKVSSLEKDINQLKKKIK